MNGPKMQFDDCDFPWNGDTMLKNKFVLNVQYAKKPLFIQFKTSIKSDFENAQFIFQVSFFWDK